MEIKQTVYSTPFTLAEEIVPQLKAEVGITVISTTYTSEVEPHIPFTKLIWEELVDVDKTKPYPYIHSDGTLDTLAVRLYPREHYATFYWVMMPLTHMVMQNPTREQIFEFKDYYSYKGIATMIDLCLRGIPKLGGVIVWDNPEANLPPSAMPILASFFSKLTDIKVHSVIQTKSKELIDELDKIAKLRNRKLNNIQLYVQNPHKPVVQLVSAETAIHYL